MHVLVRRRIERASPVLPQVVLVGIYLLRGFQRESRVATQLRVLVGKVEVAGVHALLPRVGVLLLEYLIVISRFLVEVLVATSGTH